MDANFFNADAAIVGAILRRPVIQRSVTLGSTSCEPVVFGSLPKPGSNQKPN